MRSLASIVGANCRRARRRWLRKRFARLGVGSYLSWPSDMITEPGHIEIGNGVFLRPHWRLEAVRANATASPGRVVIGDDTHVEGYFSLSAADSVEIGHDVLIGANVSIRDHDHGTAMPGVHPLGQPLIVAPVRIGDYCWLGQNCVILKGVTIGSRAVVGANAVVTRSVPDGAIVGGVPARRIGWVAGFPGPSAQLEGTNE
jgi:acetyltransferase-like isoleucine patch superfamily enzyme